MGPNEVDRVLDFFFSHTGVDEGRLESLNRDPDGAVARAVQELGLSWDDRATRAFTSVLGELRRPNAQFLQHRRSSHERVARAVGAMRRTLLLLTAMHQAMFLVGVGLAVAGLVAVLSGRTLAGATVGGVGLADAAFFLLREPTRGIREGIGNYARLRAAHQTYVAELDRIGWYSTTDPATIQRTADLVHDACVGALDLIQRIKADLGEPADASREGGGDGS